MIFYLVTKQHAYTMAWFLDSWGKALTSRITIMPYDDLVAGKGVPRDASFIFSDFDRLPGVARALLGPLHDKLVTAFGPARVLNDPLRSLLRFDLLRMLHERGANRFDAWRVNDAVVPRRFPVFVRDERGFAVAPPLLLETAEEYAAAVRDLDARNVPPEHGIAIEFCNTADKDGIYRKYGVFVAGEAIVPRHLFFSRNWFVKDADLVEPAMLAEEMAFVQTNPHEGTLREIFRLAGIAYGRIDYALVDGRLQVWEINTNPILTPRIDKTAERGPVHQHFVNMIAAAFLAIDRRA